MADPELEAALVDWTGTFAHLSKAPASLDDFTDGVVLYEIMHEVDPATFPLSGIKTDVGENWVLSESNLKRLRKGLVKHYEEHLGVDMDQLVAPDVSLIAKARDHTELIKLAQLVLGCLVKNENNQFYIANIMQLGASAQQALMGIIGEIIQLIDEHAAAPATRRLSSLGFNERFGNVDALQEERDALLAAQRQLELKLQQLRQDNDELSRERDEARARVHELEDQTTRQLQQQKVEALRRTDYDSVRTDAAKLEARLAEADETVRKQALVISDLNRRMESVSKQAEEAQALRDQVDDLKHVAEKLEKTERQLDALKKKAEDANDLRRQLKSVQSELEALQNNAAALAATDRTSSGLQSVVDDYKRRYAALDKEKEELQKAHTRAEVERMQAQSQLALRNQEYEKQSATLRSLQERLEEAELNASLGGSAGGTDLGHGTIVAELRTKNAQLEQENRMLRAAGGADGAASGQAAVLDAILSDTKAAKDKLEADYKTVLVENLGLKERVTMLETEMVGARMKASEEKVLTSVLAERERDLRVATAKLSETERANGDLQRKLAATEASLNDKQREMLSLRSELQLLGQDKVSMMEGLKQQFESEMQEKTRDLAKLKDSLASQLETLRREHDDLKEEHARIVRELGETKEQSTAQLKEIRELQAKNLAILESRLSSQGESGDASLLREKLSSSEQRNADLQSRLTQAMAKIASQQEALRKARDHIKQMDQQLVDVTRQRDDAAQSGQSGANFDEAYKSLRAEIASKEGEISTLKQSLKELRETARNEQRLMAAAWYNLNIQAQRKAGGAQRTGRTSWMAQQRQDIDRTAPVRPSAGS